MDMQQMMAEMKKPQERMNEMAKAINANKPVNSELEAKAEEKKARAAHAAKIAKVRLFMDIRAEPSKKNGKRIGGNAHLRIVGRFELSVD